MKAKQNNEKAAQSFSYLDLTVLLEIPYIPTITTHFMIYLCLLLHLTPYENDRFFFHNKILLFLHITNKKSLRSWGKTKQKQSLLWKMRFGFVSILMVFIIIIICCCLSSNVNYFFFFWRFCSKHIHQSYLFALIFAVVHNHIEQLISLNRINRFVFSLNFCLNSMTIFLSHFSLADSLFHTHQFAHEKNNKFSFCLHFVHLVSYNK